VNLFRIDASLRLDGSVSRSVADTFETAWSAAHPGGSVTRRDVGTDPFDSALWAGALTGGPTPTEARTADQHAGVALATAVADELLAADAVVVATPLYNYGVQPMLKAWTDLVISDSRFGGGQQPLAGRPLVIVIARGGGYGEGTPKHGWDHATGYLQRIFGDVFGMDVHVVEAELTLADVVPAMEALRGLAAESQAAAHLAAGAHGQRIAELAGATAAA
jgi:FMN-dependent NADH-azoreductase